MTRLLRMSEACHLMYVQLLVMSFQARHGVFLSGRFLSNLSDQR